MKVKGIVLSIFCIFCLTLFSFCVTTTYADTTQSCTNGQYNCFDGFERDFGSSGVTSVYTDIYTPLSYPANYSQSATTAWPMISNNGSTNQYVQVGWMESNQETGFSGSSSINIPNGVHYFYEINYGSGYYCSNCDYQVYSTVGPAQNSTHGYRVALTSGNWVGTVDTAQIASFSTQFSSYVNFTSGEYAKFCEEIASDKGTAYNSAFAGTSSSHSSFSNIRAFYNGTTYNSPGPTTYFQDADAMYDFSNYSSSYTNQSNSFVTMWDSRY